MSSSCFDLNSYRNNLACSEPVNARVSAIAFTDINYTFNNISSTNEWLDLICNGRAIVFNDIRGSYDGGAATEAAGYGQSTSRVSNYTHTVNASFVFNPVNNEFFDSFNFESGNLKLWFFVDRYLMSSEKNVSSFFAFSNPIADDRTSIIETTVVAKWVENNIIDIHEPPQGIFVSCSNLNRLLACHTCEPLPLPDDCIGITPSGCCRGNISMITPPEAIGVPGTGSYRIFFRYDENVAVCNPSVTPNSYSIGTIANPNQVSGTIEDKEYLYQFLSLPPAGGNFRVTLTYSCNGSVETFDFPYPPHA